MTLVIASLVEGSIAGVSSSSKKAFRQGADAVEVRLDHLKGLTLSGLEKVRDAVDGPTIATLRSAKEGGRSKLGKKAREELLRAVVASGFHAIDLEVDNDRALLKELGESDERPLTIASAHFTDPTSESEVESALAQACMLGDVGKVAMPCENASHALMLAEVGMRASRRGKRSVVIGMGAQGQLTRVCASRIGSAMMYSCLRGKEAAPGQLDVATQREMLDDPIVLGLVGHPVSHSVSKPMQEAALRAASLEGVYLPLDFPPESFNQEALATVAALGFRGLNVTVPHKAGAFQLSAKKGAAALATGAVNTITFDGAEISGENTDVYGFKRTIEGKTSISKKTRALMVGAGGVSRAVAYVLKKHGVRFDIVDIDGRRAVDVARSFGGRPVTQRELRADGTPYDLVINCTPVGMKGVPGCPVEASIFRKGSVFIDVIYNPQDTRAMRLARAKGARVQGGLEMLVQQGAQSFRLWTGQEPSIGVMRDAARRALR